MFATIYAVIGIAFAIHALWAVKKDIGKVDPIDVGVCTIFFGLVWPVGAIVWFCIWLPTVINKKA